MRIRMYSEKPRHGAKVLSRRLRRCLNIKRKNSKFKPKAGDVIINWGNSALPMEYFRARIINDPASVAAAVNKLATFELLKEVGVSIPRFAENYADLAAQVGKDSFPVIARTKLRASKADGVYYCEDKNAVDELTERLGGQIKLWVEYIKKFQEYRVHVIDGKAVLVAQKRKVKEEEADFKIRNHQNGWIYAVNDIEEPHPSVLEESVKAVKALKLDFGSVDVIWSSHKNQAFVLEVNTAPGLAGETTINKFYEGISKLIG